MNLLLGIIRHYENIAVHLKCETVICTFTTDSGEFINGNEVTNENHNSAHSAIPTITKTNNQSQYRFILPRSPLQELNQRYQ
ncbi:unnamed protein product [Rhizophagus irregularis]|nr:unnamed protein product [Rhizophagus irregularis]